MCVLSHDAHSKKGPYHRANDWHDAGANGCTVMPCVSVYAHGDLPCPVRTCVGEAGASRNRNGSSSLVGGPQGQANERACENEVGIACMLESRVDSPYLSEEGTERSGIGTYARHGGVPSRSDPTSFRGRTVYHLHHRSTVLLV